MCCTSKADFTKKGMTMQGRQLRRYFKYTSKAKNFLKVCKYMSITVLLILKLLLNYSLFSSKFEKDNKFVHFII